MSLKTRTSPLKYLSILQILLVCLTIVTAAAVLGTAANIYHVFVSQQASGTNPWWLPLWTSHFNTSGLKASIGIAGSVVLINVIFLASIAAGKTLSGLSRSSILYATVTVSISSILLAVASMVLSSPVENHLPASESIRNWVCRFKDAQATQAVVSDMSNSNFDSLCKQSEFDFYGNIGVVSLQVILLASALLQFRMGKNGVRELASQHSIHSDEDKSSSFGGL